jgi:tetratricopeptide (TPR) repeat protein
MYAATLTPMLEEKLKIYEAATKKGDEWTAYNNLGATYLSLAAKTNDAEMKKTYLTKAKAQFELAVNKEATATALTNLATTQLMMGDNASASTTLDKAAKATKATTESTKALNESLGVIAIRKGQYDNAIKALSSVSESAINNHNLGLAYLMKKDYAKAEMILEKASSANTDQAITYYLRAVNAARQNKEAALGILLKQAVSKDIKLKEKALRDLEFVNFVTNPVFTNSLK